MNFKINKTTFLKHLNNISIALSSSTYLKSLQGIKMTVTESNIKLVASNGTLSVKEIIDAGGETEIIQPGVILIPGKLLINIIKQQKDLIQLILEDEKLIINANNFKTNINILNLSDYPQISFDAFGDDLEIDTSDFKKLVTNVSYAAADSDNSKQILTGVNLKAFEGSLTASATNSYRLATNKIKINSDIDFNITIISNNLKYFLPTNATGNINITINDNQIITKYNTTTIMSNLIDGSYTEIEKLIPDNFNSTLTIDAKQLNNLIDKATVVSDEQQKTVRVSINNEQITMESKRKEVGDAVVYHNDHNFEGSEIVITFNAQYLKNAISKLNGIIKIFFIANDKPFLVKTSENESFIQMILPHRSY